MVTAPPNRARLSAASEGPSDQQILDYIREDLERGRSEYVVSLIFLASVQRSWLLLLGVN